MPEEAEESGLKLNKPNIVAAFENSMAYEYNDDEFHPSKLSLPENNG